MKYWLQLQAATPQIDWVVEDDLVRDVRLIKSPRELALYREAGEYVTRAHVAMMEALIAGRVRIGGCVPGRRTPARAGLQLASHWPSRMVM